MKKLFKLIKELKADNKIKIDIEYTSQKILSERDNNSCKGTIREKISQKNRQL